MPSETIPHDAMVGGMPVTGGYDAYSRALETNYSSVEKERESYRSELVTSCASRRNDCAVPAIPWPLRCVSVIRRNESLTS